MRSNQLTRANQDSLHVFQFPENEQENYFEDEDMKKEFNKRKPKARMRA
jgi:hypothetical protein